MGWADLYIQKLQAGESVSFRPRGNSMTPLIQSGQLVTVAPVVPDTIRIGDVVLCRVKGQQYLHLVRAIREGQFMIGNNHGKINGWISPNAIYGKCVKIDS